MPSTTDFSPLARALGRIPTGLYVVTTRSGGSGHSGSAPLGFVGSFLIQTGFEPPSLCVAIAKGREHLEAIREAGGFAVSILDSESSGLMSPFFKKYGPGESAFDQLRHADTPGGMPYLEEALAWLDCRLQGEHETPDHTVCFGTVEAGGLLREGDPSVHLRKNGLAY